MTQRAPERWPVRLGPPRRRPGPFQEVTHYKSVYFDTGDPALYRHHLTAQSRAFLDEALEREHGMRPPRLALTGHDVLTHDAGRPRHRGAG